MLPLGKLASPIRVELYTSANDDGIYYGVGAAGAHWQLVNVELELCYVEISEDGYEDNREVDFISTQSYRHTSTAMQTPFTGEFNTLLGFRFVYDSHCF